jgi:hypothetical protein
MKEEKILNEKAVNINEKITITGDDVLIEYIYRIS